MSDPIARANEKLDRVKIRQKGKYLYLRATLPDKQGGEKWKQTDVRTGCPANDKGYKAALAKAQKMESDLIFERFNWDDWLGEKEKGLVVPLRKNIETAVAKHREWYWESRKKTKTREEGYAQTYGRWFDRLPLDEAFNLDNIKKALLRLEADGYQRSKAHFAYQSLVRVNGLEWPKEWAILKGTYQPADRHIPSEDEVLEVWERLSPDWRWVVGMLFTYGLRPHELFTLDLERWPIIKTHKSTKTGERLVWPVSHQRDLVELFSLGDRHWPQFELGGTETNRQLGRKITSGFLNKQIPFVSYSLRDAFAIRCAVVGIDSAIAARLMGHTIHEHCKSYLKYIDELSTARIIVEKVPYLAGKS